MTTTSPAAFGLVLLLAACSGDPTAAMPSTTDTALLRVVNGTSGAPISVAIDGRLAIERVTAQAPSAYVGVPAGTHTLEVRSAELGTPLGSRPVTFQKDSSYTLVAPAGDGGGDPLVAIDTGAVPAAGKVKFRVVHAAPDAPALDVYLTEEGAPLADAFPYVTPFVYGVGTSADFPGYVERDPGTYEVRFTGAGTADVLLDTGPLPATAGQVFSVVLLQQSDTLGDGLAVQILRDR
jgi:hypothetical protein